MKEFKSFADFGREFVAIQAAELAALKHGLEKCARLIEKDAKSMFGHYQDATGLFPKWAELADSTQAGRERLGFPANEPLLRTGELRDSITHKVSGAEAVVGSDSDVMVYQEFGTDRIPPRPVLGPAVFRNKEQIQRIIGAAAVSGILNGRPVDDGMGYNFETE